MFSFTIKSEFLFVCPIDPQRGLSIKGNCGKNLADLCGSSDEGERRPQALPRKLSICSVPQIGGWEFREPGSPAAAQRPRQLSSTSVVRRRPPVGGCGCPALGSTCGPTLSRARLQCYTVCALASPLPRAFSQGRCLVCETFNSSVSGEERCVRAQPVMLGWQWACGVAAGALGEHSCGQHPP